VGEGSVLVVVATYNEIDNLPRLIAQLVDVLPQAQILVIDDGSPDGTGRWCDRAVSQYPQLRVIHREDKLGLGSATILGFQQAITQNIPLVATMDADLSHDPASLPQLLAALQTPPQPPLPTGYMMGVALGSRYVDGGRIEGWPLRRRLVSKCVNFYSRILLRLKTRDNSGAFRVYRTAELERIDLGNLRSSGYGYLEEILCRLNELGVPMVEVPITFRDRTQGRSKTSLLEGVKVFWEILKLGISLRTGSKQKHPRK
jgi:dolichol-phosphate mannosyltransferase